MCKKTSGLILVKPVAHAGREMIVIVDKGMCLKSTRRRKKPVTIRIYVTVL